MGLPTFAPLSSLDSFSTLRSSLQTKMAGDQSKRTSLENPTEKWGTVNSLSEWCHAGYFKRILIQPIHFVTIPNSSSPPPPFPFSGILLKLECIISKPCKAVLHNFSTARAVNIISISNKLQVYCIVSIVSIIGCKYSMYIVSIVTIVL